MESKDTHQYLVIKGFKINMIANTKNKDDFCLRRGRKHSYLYIYGTLQYKTDILSDFSSKHIHIWVICSRRLMPIENCRGLA